jgi:cytoskeleton protein RodZ
MSEGDSMTEAQRPDAGEAPGVSGPSAGALLRAAREQRGIHIAAMAAAMKVPQRKLEALEGDRHDELPDLTFTRALAQSVCRHLKIDVQPVLDRLPQSGVASPRLEQVGVGLNAPFRERPGREEPADWSWVRRPVVWGTLIVLAAAAALALLPDSWLGKALKVGGPGGPAASTSSVTDLPAVPAMSSAASASPAASSGAAEAASAAAPAASAASSASASVIPPLAAAPAALPTLSVAATSAESWIEVQDARGETLLSRSLAPGESVAVDGAVPLRVTVGNAASTRLQFRGKPVELAAHTRDNVARMQLN